MSSMVFLALGLAGDFYVVAYRITASHLFSFACAIVMLAFFYGLWFGYTFLKRPAWAGRGRKLLTEWGRGNRQGGYS